MRRVFSYPAFVTFLLTFAVYLFFLCPDVAWEDSGEFVTAAYCIGVPHAPGSPMVVLLGKIFSWIPVGSVAYRVNLLSAVSTALAAGFLCRFLVVFAALKSNSTPSVSPAGLTGREEGVGQNLNPLLTSPDLRGRKKKRACLQRFLPQRLGEIQRGLNAFLVPPQRLFANPSILMASQEVGKTDFNPLLHLPRSRGRKKRKRLGSVVSPKGATLAWLPQGEIQRGLNAFLVPPQRRFANPSILMASQRVGKTDFNPLLHLPRSRGRKRNERVCSGFSPKRATLAWPSRGDSEGVDTLLSASRRLFANPSILGRETEGSFDTASELGVAPSSGCPPGGPDCLPTGVAKPQEVSAIGFALAWAMSPWVMRHALAAEVYGLAWTCLLGSFLLAAIYRNNGCRASCSQYVLLGLLAGIGVSTSVLLAPFALLLCFIPFVDRRGAWIAGSRTALGLALGLLPLLLPVLRSGHPPPLYFSGASSLSGLIEYLSGAQFERQVIGAPFPVDSRVWLFAALGILLPVLFALRLSPRPRWIWLVAVAIVNLVFLLFRRHPGHFFVPWLTAVLCLGYGVCSARFRTFVGIGLIIAASVWSYSSPLRTGEIPLRWAERTVSHIPASSTSFLGEINATFPLLYSRVVQGELEELTIHPVWNSTRVERLHRLRSTEGVVYTDMDLVDFATRVSALTDPFADAVPDPVLFNVSPPERLSWDSWWDAERRWLREYQPCMTRLDRRVLGEHYFNLGVFCLERGNPLGEDLVGLARGLNPELPQLPDM